jgi:hypothetical protein
VQPLATGSEAVLAALDRRRQFVDRDLIEVGARGAAHVTSSTAGVRERWAWTNWTAIVPLPTARSFGSAKYQLPRILEKVSRYRSEAIMILRLPFAEKR